MRAPGRRPSSVPRSWRSRFGDALRDREKLAWPLPAWDLPPRALARWRAAAPRLALLELAGRDSVAAALSAARAGAYDILVPTIAYAGTEFGDWRAPFRHVDFLRARLAAEGTRVRLAPPVVLGAPRLWRALCGRAAALTRRYGVYPPCVGCHLYFHALRLPLAVAAAAPAVVTGERTDHGGRAKVNQLGFVLDRYARFAGEFGVELRMPLRAVADDAAVADVVGPGGPSAADQTACVLSGNYEPEGGLSRGDEAAVAEYLDTFAIPRARAAVRAWLAGGVPDVDAEARAL